MSFEYIWTPDLDQYGERLKAKSSELETALAEKMEELAERLLSSIEAKLSGEVLQERTGNLLRSVHIQAAEWTGQVCRMAVGIDDSSPTFVYGIAFEMGGLGYYYIFPKQALALAWEGPEKMIFAKHVHHPPAPHRPFMAPSLEELAGVFDEELAAVVEAVFGA